MAIAYGQPVVASGPCDMHDLLKRHDRVRDVQLEFLTLRENYDYHAHHRLGARLLSPRHQRFCDPTDKTRDGWEV